MKPRRTGRSKSMRRKTLKRGKPRNSRNVRTNRNAKKSRWMRRGGATCDDANQRVYDHVMTFPYAK